MPHPFFHTVVKLAPTAHPRQLRRLARTLAHVDCPCTIAGRSLHVFTVPRPEADLDTAPLFVHRILAHYVADDLCDADVATRTRHAAQPLPLVP